ncbi:hypothetical protein [Streptomyces bluensis]|uniref:hypothetical protein n=1 Tax=Streptomyces bluensis TaxID=33897 RepID=UPI00332CC40C
MKPHAEIAEVWPRDGRIRLVGRLHGLRSDEAAGPAVTWRLVVTRRAHPDQRLRYEVRVQGDRFEGELPIADLATADHATVEEWDIHLSDGAAELRAGRRLDDVRGKKQIFVYPEQRTGNLSVRPYYTIKDNLSVESRTGGSA